MTITAKGHAGATVTFDGERITIERKGFLAKMSVGAGERTIPLAALSAVEWEEPTSLKNGSIRFVHAGGIEAGNIAQDPDGVIVTKQQARQFHDLRDAVEAAITNRPVDDGDESLADELAALRAQAEPTGLRKAIADAPDATFDVFGLHRDKISKAVSLSEREEHPLSGVTARVERGSDLEARVTATRLVALGIFAFAAKKKSGGESYLTLEGPDFFWTTEVDRRKTDGAYAFAAKVNDRVRKLGN